MWPNVERNIPNEKRETDAENHIRHFNWRCEDITGVVAVLSGIVRWRGHLQTSDDTRNPVTNFSGVNHRIFNRLRKHTCFCGSGLQTIIVLSGLNYSGIFRWFSLNALFLTGTWDASAHGREQQNAMRTNPLGFSGSGGIFTTVFLLYRTLWYTKDLNNYVKASSCSEWPLNARKNMKGGWIG
jgi:hypothetical protein